MAWNYDKWKYIDGLGWNCRFWVWGEINWFIVLYTPVGSLFVGSSVANLGALYMLICEIFFQNFQEN